MRQNIFYVPWDEHFPFVDMMWRQGDELFAVQVTVSDTHPKSFRTFKESWLNAKLGVSLDGIVTAPAAPSGEAASDQPAAQGAASAHAGGVWGGGSSAPTRINLIYVLLPRFANWQQERLVAPCFAWKPTTDAKNPLLEELRQADRIQFLIAKPAPQDAESWAPRTFG
jgi:hypothetical protein